MVQNGFLLFFVLPAGLIRPRVREVEELRNKICQNWYATPVKELANRIFWHRKLNLFCQFYVPSLTVAYMLHLPLPIKLIFLTSSTKSTFIALQLILTHIYRSSVFIPFTYQIEHFTQQDIQKRGSVQRWSLAFSLLSWPSRPWQVAAECLCKKNIHASQCVSTASMTVSRTEEEILISRRVIAGKSSSFSQ